MEWAKADREADKLARDVGRLCDEMAGMNA
jgi:hypothetical protein